MRELSLHILDLLENSVEAGASRIRLSIREDLQADWMPAALLAIPVSSRPVDLDYSRRAGLLEFRFDSSEVGEEKQEGEFFL